MYLYFDKQGVLTTQIPHGEIVRQSGTFTMHFAFEIDYDFVNRYSLTINFKRPGEKVFGNTYYVPVRDKPQPQVFKKIKSNEITYSFIEGQEYVFYDFICDSTIGASERTGEVEAVVRILDKYSLEKNEEKVKSVITQGLVTFHVERTFGIPYSNTISPTQYDYLLAYIDKKAEGINDTYVKKVEYEEKDYRLTFTNQDDNKLIVDFPIEDLDSKIDTKFDEIQPIPKDEIENLVEPIENDIIITSRTGRIGMSQNARTNIYTSLGKINIGKNWTEVKISGGNSIEYNPQTGIAKYRFYSSRPNELVSAKITFS